MRRLWTRLRAKRRQFQIETELLVAGLHSLIVNLACMGRLRLAQAGRVIVLVDSRREGAFLRLLSLLTIVPRCNVCEISSAEDIHVHVQASAAEDVLVATSRVCSKYYQSVASLRRRRQLIVL